MYNNFVQRLKRIKQEVLALKTAQPKGLGSANFFGEVVDYEFSVVSGSPLTMRVVVEFGENQSAIPYCQCYISEAQYFQGKGVSWDGEAKKMYFDFDCYVNNVTLNGQIKVISNGAIGEVYVEGL